jgi:hypothetical protein
MDALIQMEWTIALISGLIGMVIGIIIGITALHQLGKCQFREKINNEIKMSKVANKIINPRQDKRNSVHYLNPEIIAPILDGVGTATRETMKFNAVAVNISQNGIALISQYFLKPGLTVKICSKGNAEKIHFSLIDAEVRNINITPRGLKIGLQFLKPLKKLKNI